TTIETIYGHFLNLLQSALSAGDAPLSALEILSQEEKTQLLYEFNDTKNDYPGDKTIHQLFEEQVRRRPDAMAIAGKSILRRGRLAAAWHYLTYSELNKKAGQLAYHLKEIGITADTPVGIMLTPSLEMAVGILGILKAGGAYLPVDSQYPPDRITFMFKDSGTGILLSEENLLNKIRGNGAGTAGFEGCNIIDLRKFLEPDGKAKLSMPESGVTHQASDLVYIIYTSGTTGQPKGVAVEHRNLVNYTCWRLDSYAFSSGDITLQLLSYAFDGFCSNFYSSLTSGGSLILTTNLNKMDFTSIANIMVERAVTNISLVPVMYEAILNSSDSKEFKHLRFVVFAGEKASEHLLKRSHEYNPHLRHIIEYGPTETTVTATANIDIKSTDTSIIGNPIANAMIFILNERMYPQPIGVPGELCISGDGMARGYINRPELTAEKFVTGRLPNNQSPITDNHLYRTGDLTRWLPDGNIEFLGRIDLQVKIRGFRIEIGEIENTLLNIKEIKETIVTARIGSSGEKYLCAYCVTAESDEKLDMETLKENMRLNLPDYMIPTYFVRINKIPLTANGKVDLDALPAPDVIKKGEHYLPPTNNIEAKLIVIWADVLDMKKNIIGINDNFFK
ncbi:MAG: amino acid adenylation domain-containing protein, partial [bacterium]|nr:amino acid adenylation domain-containing protein [bacterium]